MFDELMRRAVGLAQEARPHPNPRVGAVVISSEGTVVGEGSHAGPGSPHAEALALEAAGPAARGGTLVVTLEPCVHVGSTGPCVEEIIAAGVSRVAVGLRDPDPRVDGRGLEALRSAGIEVVEGVAAEAVTGLDPGYLHHRRTGRPRVTLKLAVTLDGQAAAADGSSQWITGPEARADAHLLRAEADAVMVGAGTALADDPRLTVRLPGYSGPGPIPVVVAGRRTLPPDLRLFARKAMVLAPRALDLPAEVIVAGDRGSVDLHRGLEELGSRGVVDLLAEGGPRLAGSLWARGLVDRVVLYYGARLGGGVGVPGFSGRFPTLEAAAEVTVSDVRRVGTDLRVELTGRVT